MNPDGGPLEKWDANSQLAHGVLGEKERESSETLGLVATEYTKKDGEAREPRTDGQPLRVRRPLRNPRRQEGPGWVPPAMDCSSRS